MLTKNIDRSGWSEQVCELANPTAGNNPVARVEVFVTSCQFYSEHFKLADILRTYGNNIYPYLAFKARYSPSMRTFLPHLIGTFASYLESSLQARFSPATCTPEGAHLIRPNSCSNGRLTLNQHGTVQISCGLQSAAYFNLSMQGYGPLKQSISKP